MLSNEINELENKIKALADISGFKKSITEHNKIQKELEKCKTRVEQLEKFVDTISTNDESLISVNDQIEQITDEIYQQYLSEIKMLNEIFDRLEIDEQVQVYQNIMNKIKICDNYLKSQKMEIFYIDKKDK